MQTLTLTRPDDWHIHLRDGDYLPSTVADVAERFGRAIVMPNLKPPVTTVDLAKAYRSRIDTALQQLGVSNFNPLMTLYFLHLIYLAYYMLGSFMPPTHLRLLFMIAAYCKSLKIRS